MVMLASTRSPSYCSEYEHVSVSLENNRRLPFMIFNALFSINQAEKNEHETLQVRLWVFY